MAGVAEELFTIARRWWFRTDGAVWRIAEFHGAMRFWGVKYKDYVVLWLREVDARDFGGVNLYGAHSRH